MKYGTFICGAGYWFFVSIFSLTAFGTTLPAPENPPPPQKPIDQLITAAGIYKHDLAVMDLKTLEITPLTDDYTVEQEPTWSPDGKSVLYSAIDDAWHELRLLNLETGDKKTVLKEDGVSFTGPDWSPDKRVVFTVRDQLRHRSIELGTGDITESGVQNITKIPIMGYDPTWGKDGRIYFTGTTKIDGYPELASPNPVFLKPEVHSISAMDTTVNTDISLTILKDYASCQPSFSYNGEKIAFGAYRMGFNDLYIHDIKNNKTMQVSDNKFEDRDPVWSPTSNDLYYVSDRNGAFQLFRANKRGREFQITENLDFDIRHPAISPDGKKMVLETITPIDPNIPKTENQERDTYFRGKCHFNNYTDFTPRNTLRHWLKPFFAGTFKLASHGEMIYEQSDNGDLVAAYFDNEIQVYSHSDGWFDLYLTVRPDGEVITQDTASIVKKLKSDGTPKYEKWKHYKDGKPIFPGFPFSVLTESSQPHASVTNVSAWAIELPDGAWYGCQPIQQPIPNAILFFKNTYGEVEIKRDVGGERLVDIGVIHKGNHVEFYDVPETAGYNMKVWPFGSVDGPLPMHEGWSFPVDKDNTGAMIFNPAEGIPNMERGGK